MNTIEKTEKYKSYLADILFWLGILIIVVWIIAKLIGLT
jgi:hypothetical protein